MTEKIASSKAEDQLERKLVIQSCEEPYNKTSNLPGTKCDQIVIYSLRKTYFQKFNLLFAGLFHLAWESNLDWIHYFAI